MQFPRRVSSVWKRPETAGGFKQRMENGQVKNYHISANGHEWAIQATTRRTALAGAMLEMLRAGYIRLLNFDAERVATWHITEVK